MDSIYILANLYIYCLPFSQRVQSSMNSPCKFDPVPCPIFLASHLFSALRSSATWMAPDRLQPFREKMQSRYSHSCFRSTHSLFESPESHIVPHSSFFVTDLQLMKYLGMSTQYCQCHGPRSSPLESNNQKHPEKHTWFFEPMGQLESVHVNGARHALRPLVT